MRGIMVVVGIACVLSGCGSNTEDDLRQWVVEERNQTRPRINVLPAPKQFVPERYQSSELVEPFNSGKLAQALKRDSSQAIKNSALVEPELLRKKEHLESFPLDAMVFVGSIKKQGQHMALIKVDNLLYQVRSGNYLGQNYGKVLSVSEEKVQIREIVQDVVGEWTERTAALELQEVSK
ncbi:MAG: pilus assembly protein PilP [Rhodoferax sp.]|nr:pilus assembly protein PilP [Rhodoferax sp.]